MAFNWIFPEGTSEVVVTQSAGFGPIYLNDGFQLEWTPKDLRATILLACDEADGTYFIGNRTYDASPGFWRLTDRPVYDENPNCHFAYDGSDGNAKQFKYINSANPKGSTTWSASTSTSSSSASTSTGAATSTSSSAQTTSVESTLTTATQTNIPTATGINNTSNDAAPASHRNTIAIGVGVGLGVACLIGLIAALFLFLRHRRRRAAHVPAVEYQQKAYIIAPPLDSSDYRAYELNGESQKSEMESQDKRRVAVVEIG